MGWRFVSVNREFMPVLDFRKALKHREAHALRQHRPLLMLILLMGIMALAADSLRQPGLWAMLDRAASSVAGAAPGHDRQSFGCGAAQDCVPR